MTSTAVNDTTNQSASPRYGFIASTVAGFAIGVGVAYVSDLSSDVSVHVPLPTEAASVVNLGPDPKWSPSEVVTIQLEALEYAAKHPKGYECCYRFASPANVQALGSLDNFSRIVQENYGVLIGSKSRLLGREMVSDLHATVLVSCVGNDSSITCYRFLLSKCQEEPCVDCWLTDSVYIMTDSGPAPPNTPSNRAAVEVSEIN